MSTARVEFQIAEVQTVDCSSPTLPSCLGDPSNNVTSGVGIQLSNTNNMRVYHNDFRGCYSYCTAQSVSAMDSNSGTTNNSNTTTTGSNNRWDNGYPSGGNFWYEYPGVDNCSGPQQNVCPSPDGIGDTPFGLDQYPLMQPVSVTVNSPASPTGGGGGMPPRQM